MYPFLQKKEELKFLCNPDDLVTFIRCVECRERLWKQRIMKRIENKVASTETLPTGRNTLAFSNTIERCPLCYKGFYVQLKGKQQMYLIEDAHTGKIELI